MTGVEGTVEIRRGQRQAFLRKVKLPRASRGHAARCGPRVVLRHVRGALETRRVTVKLPRACAPASARSSSSAGTSTSPRATCSTSSASTSAAGAAAARPAEPARARAADRGHRALRRRDRAAPAARPGRLRPGRPLLPRPRPADLGQGPRDDPRSEEQAAALSPRAPPRTSAGVSGSARKAATSPGLAQRALVAQQADLEPVLPRDRERCSPVSSSRPRRGQPGEVPVAVERRAVARVAARREVGQRGLRLAAPSRGQTAATSRSGPEPRRAPVAGSASRRTSHLGDLPRARAATVAARAAAPPTRHARQLLHRRRAPPRPAPAPRARRATTSAARRRSRLVEPVHDAGRRERGRVDARQRRLEQPGERRPCSPRSARAAARPASARPGRRWRSPSRSRRARTAARPPPRARSPARRSARPP